MSNPLSTGLTTDNKLHSAEIPGRTLEEEFDVLSVESAEQERVQTILCIRRMPGKSGMERRPEVTRIIASGHIDTGDRVQTSDLFHLQRQNTLLTGELKLSVGTTDDTLQYKRELPQCINNANNDIVRNGLILSYQIIAPTTWNFSPRDENNNPDALERALEGTPVHRNGKESVAIQHVVRSFNPCMVCTVH